MLGNILVPKNRRQDKGAGGQQSSEAGWEDIGPLGSLILSLQAQAQGVFPQAPAVSSPQALLERQWTHSLP